MGVSGTRGFSQNHYVAKEILELPVISPHLLGARITSVYITPGLFGAGDQSWALYVLGKPCTSYWALPILFDPEISNICLSVWFLFIHKQVVSVTLSFVSMNQVVHT